MTDEWTGGLVSERDDDGPPTVETWQQVTVPDRRPELELSDDERRPVAYRTSLEDPRTSDDERVTLEISGADGPTTVWLDGEKLGESSAPYFVPTRFTIDSDPAGELLVVCEPSDAFAGIDATDEVPAAFATPRIRWGVDVDTRPQSFLRRLDVRPQLDVDGEGPNQGRLEIEIEVDTAVELDDSISLTVRPVERGGGATMERFGVTAAPGERATVSRTVEIRDPSLWWPRGYGPQHRYVVRAKFGDDVRERTFGFRRIERDADGLLVNGTRVQARGFTRLPGSDPRADVERALEANATLVRARGHVPDPAFHEACDEAGLVVWQDLPASGPEFANRLTEDGVVDRGQELVETLAGEYGHHPSLGLYGIQDEPANPFSEPVGGGIRGKLAVRYRAWRASTDRGPAEAIAEAAPDDVPVVPVTGPVGTDSDATRLAPGWEYLEATDLAWLLERYSSLSEIVGGIGAGSLVDDVDPADVPGLNADALERRVDDPAASRTYQARTLKTGVETLRREGCGVFAVSTLRDVAAGGGMGVTTVDGEEKPAFRAVKDALEPVQAVLEDSPRPGRSTDVVLCNDTGEPLEATVGWQAGDDDGETTVTVDAFGTTAAGSVEVPSDADAVELVVQTPQRTATNRYRL